jgi:hypothetical protein
MRSVSRLSVALALTIVSLSLALAACGSSGGAASATAPAGITTGAGAAAAVATRSPLFDGIGSKDPDVIGASAWWTATPVGSATPPSAWTVVYEVGWGDCQAGCIDRHTWTYRVGADGSVTFQSEDGAALPDDVLAARLAAAAGPGVGGRVTAGPVCPVERPNDPSCAARMIGDAVLVVKRGDAEVARTTTDGSGLYRIPLAPGDYILEPQPVTGLMGTAAPVPFTVTGSALVPLDVSYDTGIR